MEKISGYCMEFAERHSLKAVRDKANNVIIFKAGTTGYENSEPIILQGHLDMVCQKAEECDVDFEKDGLDIFIDGDLIKAKGTTLGADNGIAVAMILAILEGDDISHPPIEAVFTTDEEIGMIGAGKLDLSLLKAKKMINIDSEDPSCITVSCAGGSDFQATIPVVRERTEGTCIKLTVKGLKGGHSGIEINGGRVNANCLMARILDYAKKLPDFEIIGIDGGDKGNAIPSSCTAELLVKNAEVFVSEMKKYTDIIKKEISERESAFATALEVLKNGSFEVISDKLKDKLIFMLLCAPRSKNAGGILESKKG